jgi:hypothetical protein
MDPDAMTPTQLEAWQAQLEKKLEDLDAKVKPLLANQETTRQQLDLVRRLLSLAISGSDPGRLLTDPRSDQVRSDAPVADTIATILEGAAQPLHISEIRKRYLALGRRIPGQGTETNLLAYMTKNPRFVRVAKGTYTLNGAGGTSTTTRHRRRRRKRVQPATARRSPSPARGSGGE